MEIFLIGIMLLLHHSTAQPSTQSANNKFVPQITEHNDLKDEMPKQIIESRIPSSVSVILSGEEPHFTDAVGQPIPKPQIPLQVASPINLLNPDRYEFYTFDNGGNLIKRLMTIKEIQSIVANGDGEGASGAHNLEIDNDDPAKNVQDIVESVQNVLHKQVEENKNSSEQHQPQNIMLDTPDVSSSWSMILPAIFGNTGGEIFSQNRPMQVVMTPDSDVVEPTKSVKRKPKPTKNKITTNVTKASLINDTTQNSTTQSVSIINNPEIIKPLFNRNELKIESTQLVKETKLTTPKLQPTKKKNKLKPSKIQNVEATTNKSVTKRKSTTTRSPVITTVPSTKTQTTRGKLSTRNSTLDSSKPQVLPSNLQTHLKKNKVNTTTNLLSISNYNKITTKIQNSFTKPHFPSSTEIPVTLTNWTTTENSEISQSFVVSTTAAPTKINKNKISSVKPILTWNLTNDVTFNNADLTINNNKQNVTSTTVKSQTLSSGLTLPDNSLLIENDEPFPQTASASYDMLTGQDATTTLSLNAIMNTLTHPQNDVKTKFSFDKIMASLKYNTSLMQGVNNVTQITEPVVETTTLSINENFTDRTNEDIQKSGIFATTVFPPSNENTQNKNEILNIEPLLAELLDPNLFTISTTEISGFTTTENSNSNEKVLESTETITEPDMKKNENDNRLFGGPNEIVQRVDEFISENLDTVDTDVPVKILTNQLSVTENFNKENKFVNNNMSDLIKEAATVASILEDNIKESSSQSLSSEINNSDEIKTLLTDVISQMTNTPMFTDFKPSSTEKFTNIKNPIFYSNQQINQTSSHRNNTINIVSLATPSKSPSQEFLSQFHANNENHLSGLSPLKLNQTIERLDIMHNTSNNKMEPTLTPIETFTSYDDDNDSNFNGMNLFNNSNDSILSFEDSVGQNKTKGEKFHDMFNTKDILLSTPVAINDDANLITTLMESMAATVTETPSLPGFETFFNKTATIETSTSDKQIQKEGEKANLPTFSKEEQNKDTDNDSKIKNNNIKDKYEFLEINTTIKLPQAYNINVVQKATEIPLEMTTISHKAENSNTEIESSLLLPGDKKNGDNINNNWEAITPSNITKILYNNYFNKEYTNFDESDASTEKLDSTSTMKYIDSTVEDIETVLMKDKLNDVLNYTVTINNPKEENFINKDFIINITQLPSSEPIAATFSQKLKETEESYEKLGEPKKSNTKPETQHIVQQYNITTDKQLIIKTSTTNSIGLSTVQFSSKQSPSTLKPVHYFKQPTSITDQKLMSFNGSQQRPIIRPPNLSNLKITQISQLTRPPVKLDPTPEKSLGLEVSVMDLQEDIQEFARLCNELAFNYWRSITSEKISAARSLVISPFALTSMLSMIFLGARGSTSGEMNEILRLDDMVTFNPHLVFKNITESVERANDNGIASSAFVRELFSDRNNGKILPFFKDKVHQFYSGHVEEVKFNVVNDIIRRRTNLLIKRHANGKVLEYLRTNSVWVNGPLSTVSANLFQTDCSKASTIDRDGEMFFQVNPTIRQRRLVPIPAVVYRNGFTAGYDAELDATTVAFGSADETVSTIYVMPGQPGLAMPGDKLERLEKGIMTNGILNNSWSHLLTSLMERPGLEIQLPRFSHRSFVNASFGLQKLGLKALFNSDKADLRGLTGSSQKDVHLADMIQINTFSTCGEEKISNHHHVEMYPAPPLRKRNSDLSEFDSDMQTPLSEMHNDFGLLVQDAGRSLYDDLLDPKYLELPLPLRPRQARIPDSPRLRLDKPFIYFVRHNPTGMILFMGRFNPRLLP